MTSIPINITHRALYAPHSGYARCRNTEIDADKVAAASEELRIAMLGQFTAFAGRIGIPSWLAQAMLMNATETVPPIVARESRSTKIEEPGNLTTSPPPTHRLVDGR